MKFESCTSEVKASVPATIRLGGYGRVVWAGVVLALASGVQSLAADYYVSSVGGNHFPYDSWGNAATVLQSAIAVASAGDTVWVTNGVYAGDRRSLPAPLDDVATHGYAAVVVDKAVAVRSVNGPAVTWVVGAADTRCVYLTNQAVLSGFTLTNGHAPSYGGGVLAEPGAVVTDCVLTGNEARYRGGGSYQGNVYNSIYRGNTSMRGGAAAGSSSAGHTLRNCLLEGNTATSIGGGAHDLVLRNCTVVRNKVLRTSGAEEGGGVARGNLLNCIVLFNEAPIRSNIAGAKVAHTCATPELTDYPGVDGGHNLINADPAFVDSNAGDFRLRFGSPCRDSGSGEAWMEGNMDLDGQPRLICGVPDLGAYEYAGGEFRCAFVADKATGLVPCTVDFTGFVAGDRLEGLYYRWDFDNNGQFEVEGEGRSVVTHLYNRPDVFSVALVVSNRWGETTRFERRDSLRLAPPEVFVSPTGGNRAPFATWADAATSIQPALDVALDGTTVWVTNGVFKVTAEVAMNQGTVLRSVNGPEETTVDGGLETRCFRLNHPEVVLDGFTITRGFAADYWDGGGVALQKGTVRNCRLVDNDANGGMGGGLVAAGAGTVVERCEIRNNRAGNGGGLSVGRGGTVRNCLIVGNACTMAGGGVFAVFSGLVESCTVVKNTAEMGGGFYADLTDSYTVRNSILQFNQATTDPNYGSYWPNIFYEFDCVEPPLPAASGNIAGDPGFADLAGGDYRLASGSPCVNAGQDQPWMTHATDLAGRPRVQGGRVDLGAFEQETGSLLCAARVVSRRGLEVVLAGLVSGETNGVRCFWDFDGDGTTDCANGDTAFATNVYEAYGTYTVVLTVSNAVGQVASARHSDLVRLAPATIYVSGSGANQFPYADWSTAARDLATAVEAAGAGTVVHLAAGVVPLTNAVTLAEGIIVRGAGAEATICDAGGTGRAFILAHPQAAIERLSICNGLADKGGGVWIHSGTLRDCRLVDNRATQSGGAAYLDPGAAIERCLMVGNRADQDGGGVFARAGSSVFTCQFRDNGADGNGGGYALLAEGLNPAQVINSLFVGNAAQLRGGGLSILGSSAGTVENCTVVSNAAPSGGAGMALDPASRVAVWNSIVYDNRGSPDFGGPVTLATRSCIAGASGLGNGSFTNAPRFMRPQEGDWRLASDSPCIDQGQTRSWMAGATDLGGNARVIHGAADLGAYEFTFRPLNLDPLPAGRVLQGLQWLRWSLNGVDTNQVATDVYALNAAGQRFTLGTGIVGAGFAWDTRLLADGRYRVVAVLRDRSAPASELAQDVLTLTLNNSVNWHRGPLTLDETWSNTVVHVVEGAFQIRPGVRLTLEPGCVVKFLPAAGFALDPTAVLAAEGTARFPVVLTSWADDSVGGDVNGDGSGTWPRPGEWLGVSLSGGSQVLANEFTEFRYLNLEHGGRLSASQLWLANVEHVVTNDLVVPTGVTLSILPGAVVKFAPRTGLTVEPGGRLAAEGTRWSPITLTGTRDGTVGGAAADGAPPAAGDWGTIRVMGEASLSQVVVRYGGGNASMVWDGTAMLKVVGDGRLTVSDSVVRDAYFDALMTEGGAATLFCTNAVIAANDRGANILGGVAEFVNCTVHDNRWGLMAHGGTMRVVNTIVSQSRERGVVFCCGSGAEVFHHNNVWSTMGVNYWVGFVADYWTGHDGNISADPHHRNAAGGDFQLDYRSPCIDAADTVAASETDPLGSPRYDDPRSPNTGVSVGPDAADMGAFEFVEDLASPVDLIVTDVWGPTAVVAGDYVTVRWRVRNVGTATVDGHWHDALRFSPLNPTGWDAAITAVEAASEGNLGPGQQAEFSAEVRVPAATEGPWRWQVHGNVRGEVFEGSNWNNNLAEAELASSLEVPALALGTTDSGIFPGASTRAWKVPLPAATGLAITLEASAPCRLYAGLNRMPATERYDFSSALPAGPTAQLALPTRDESVTVYLLAVVEGAAGNPSFTIQTRVPEFGVASVSPNRIDATGRSTLAVAGGGFDTATVAWLQAADGARLPAVATRFLDSTRLEATFALTGAVWGTYSLAVTNAGGVRVLANAVTVVAAQPGRLTARLVLPAAFRVGRPFVGYIEYGNEGGSDVAAPLLVLRDVQGNTELWDLAARPSGRHNLNFLGVNQDTAGRSTLPPHSKYRIPFNGRTSGGASDTRLEVSVLATTDGYPMDYAALMKAIRPEHPHPLWTNAWQRIAGQAGTTRGQYIGFLGQAADRAAQSGLLLTAERDLLTLLTGESFEAVQKASVSGRLFLKDTSHPLGRESVLLRSVAEASAETRSTFSTTAWFDGTFGLRDVAAGDYWLEVKDYRTTSPVRVTLPDPVNAPVSNLVVVVTALGGVEGYVTDARTGQPLTNASIVLYDTMSLPCGYAQTGEGGYYAVSGLAPGRYAIQASQAGTFAFSERHKFDIAADEWLLLPLNTDARDGNIGGHTRTPAGAPLAGTTVYCSRLDPDANSPVPAEGFVAAGPDGAFSLQGLGIGTYRLTAVAKGYGSPAPVTVRLSATNLEAQVVLTLTAPRRVTGRVTAANSGLPVAGAMILTDLYPPPPSVLTDANGSFAIADLPTGACKIIVARAGYLPVETPIRLPEDEAKPLLIALKPIGAVTGLVRCGGSVAAGMPIALISRVDPAACAVVTAADGSYSVTNLAPGNYQIGVGRITGALWGLTAVALSEAFPERVVNFDLPVGRIAGRILAADGLTPLTNALVSLVSSNAVIAQSWSSVGGRYEFLILRADEFDVLAQAPDETFAWRTNVAVGLGTATSVNLALAGASLEVRVGRQDTLPLTNAWVHLKALADRSESLLERRLFVDGAGTCRFTNLPPGTYRLVAGQADLAPATRTLSVPPEGAVAEFSLAAGGVLRGRVTCGGRVEPYGRVVVALPGIEYYPGIPTDGEGVYRLAGLPSGSVTVLAVPARPGFAPVLRTLQLVAPGEQAADFECPASTNVVQGTICDAAGQPLFDVNVGLFSREGFRVLGGRTDAQGRYHLGTSPTGTFRLAVSKPGYDMLVRQVTLPVTSPAETLDSALAEPLVLPITPAPAQKSIEGEMPVMRDAGYDNESFAPSLYAAADLFGGSLGIPAPEQTRSSLAPPEDYLAVVDQARAAGNVTCKGVEDGREGCYSAKMLMLRSASDWDASYAALKQLNAANVRTALCRDALLIARAIKLAASLKQLADAARGIPSTSDPRAQLAVGVADFATTSLENIRSAIQSGDLAQVDNVMSGLNSYCGWKDLSLGDYGPKMGGMNTFAVGSAVTDVYSAIRTYQDLKDDLDQLDAGVTTGMLNYQQAEDTYQKARLDYQKHLRDLKAAAKDCKTGGGGGVPADPDDSKSHGNNGDNNNGGNGGGGQGGNGSDPNDRPDPFRDPFANQGNAGGTGDVPVPTGPIPQGFIGGGPNGQGGDPNDKISTGLRGYILPDERIYYVIHFENVPTATAPAQQVFVTDPLDPALDPDSIELGNIGFNNVELAVPAQLTRFEAVTAVATDPKPVHVRAGYDRGTHALSWTLISVDRATGALTEDPLAGFLPPNTNAPAGEGYVTFSARPWAGLPSDAAIVNQATIVFDYNEPIPTPAITNRLDAVPPTSTVDPLPPVQRESSFGVSWSGSDGGAGLASVDVYVSDDAGPWTLWQTGLWATGTRFEGEHGHHYAFCTLARDFLGNVETAPLRVQATTFVYTNGPVLAPVADQAAPAGRWLLLTNTLARGEPLGHWLFALGEQSPAGAEINLTNGVFRWLPTCAQASQTHRVLVRVTDSAAPDLQDATTFTVAVGECVTPSLGQQVLVAGEGGRVPVHLITSLPLTNLAMTLSLPAGRLTGLRLEAIGSEISAAGLTPLDPASNSFRLSLTTASNRFLLGTQQVAWLHLATVPTQSSAFVLLRLDDTVGLQPDGIEVWNFAAQAGRLTVIGTEPLLEASFDTNRQPRLVLYGQPSSTHVIEHGVMLDGSWATSRVEVLTGLWVEWSVPAGAAREFYRARKIAP
jgi:PKD repeat protein